MRAWECHVSQAMEARRCRNISNKTDFNNPIPGNTVPVGDSEHIEWCLRPDYETWGRLHIIY